MEIHEVFRLYVENFRILNAMIRLVRRAIFLFALCEKNEDLIGLMERVRYRCKI